MFAGSSLIDQIPTTCYLSFFHLDFKEVLSHHVSGFHQLDCCLLLSDGVVGSPGELETHTHTHILCQEQALKSIPPITDIEHVQSLSVPAVC